MTDDLLEKHPSLYNLIPLGFTIITVLFVKVLSKYGFLFYGLDLSGGIIPILIGACIGYLVGLYCTKDNKEGRKSLNFVTKPIIIILIFLMGLYIFLLVFTVPFGM